MALNDLKIRESEAKSRSIANLANRPTSTSGYGVANMSSQTLKERFDKMSSLIVSRFNDLVDLLGSPGAAENIGITTSFKKNVNGAQVNITTLGELIEFLKSPDFVAQAMFSVNTTLADKLNAIETGFGELEALFNSLDRSVLDAADTVSGYLSEVNEAKEKAKAWSTKTDGSVEGDLYSAKKYAQDASEQVAAAEGHAGDAATYAQKAREWAVLDNYEIEHDKYSSKHYAERAKESAARAQADYSTAMTDIAEIRGVAEAALSSVDGKMESSPVAGQPLIQNGKINTAYLPDYILHNNKFLGVYNPTTGYNYVSGGVHEGNYFIASVGGGHYYPDGTSSGSVDFEVGDWAIYVNSSHGWVKIDNTDAVRTVNGQIGAVRTLKGNYDPSATYYPGDIVIFVDTETGYSYPALKTGTSGTGTDGFMRFDSENLSAFAKKETVEQIQQEVSDGIAALDAKYLGFNGALTLFADAWSSEGMYHATVEGLNAGADDAVFIKGNERADTDKICSAVLDGTATGSDIYIYARNIPTEDIRIKFFVVRGGQ